MNKNKNTVSLDSKAGDVLTPAWAGGSGNRPWESGIFGTRQPFRFLHHWETSFSHNNEKPQISTFQKKQTPDSLTDRQSVSQSISWSISVSAAWLNSSQRPHDLSLHAPNLPFLSPVCGLQDRTAQKLLSANNYNIITNYKFGKGKNDLMGFLETYIKRKGPTANV